MSRPKKLNGEQLDEFYLEVAKDIINNGWSENTVDEIVSDLKGSWLSSSSGYEISRSLDEFGVCCYSIDSSFIEYFEDLECVYTGKVRNLVFLWVKENDIKPKHELGTVLIVDEEFSSSKDLSVGSLFYINKIDSELALYGVFGKSGSSKNILIPFELIEKYCSLFSEVKL